MSKTTAKKGTYPARKEVQQPLKINYVILLIAYGFITVLTPNMNTLDSNGPKFMTLAFLNIITFAYLFSRKELKTSPGFYTGFFTNAIGVAYTLLMIFSLLSFFNAFNKIEALLHFAKIFTTFSASYLIAILIVSEKRGIRYLSVAMTLLLVVDSITVYSEIGKYIEGKVKDIGIIRSVYSNKNILSASIFVKLPFSLWLMVTDNNWKKVLGGLASFMAMTAIFFLSSRAFYLGLIFLTIIMGLYFTGKYLQYRQLTQFKVFGLYLVMLLFSFLIFSFVQSNFYPKNKDGLNASVVSRLKTITEESGGGRYEGWIRSWHVFKEHPLLGVGIGNWKIATLKEENYSKADFTYQYKAHNDFVETTTEAGIFAGISFLLIFVLVGWKFLQLIFRKEPPAALSIFLLPTFGLLCYTMDAFFNFPQDRPEIQALFALYIAMAIALTIDIGSKSQEPHSNAFITSKLQLEIPLLRKRFDALSEPGEKRGSDSQTLRWGLSGLFMVLLFSSGYFLILNFQSLKLQRIIKQEINKGKLTSTADTFLNGFPFIPNLNVVGEPIAAQKARYLIHEKRYDEAIAILKSDKSSPFDTRIEYFLSMAYFEKNMPDSAIYYSHKVYEMKPLHFKNVSVLTNTMLMSGKQKEAEAILDQFMSHKRKDKDACLYACSFYDKTGSLDKAVIIIDSATVWFPKDTTVIRQKNYLLRKQVLSSSKATVDAALEAYRNKRYPEAINYLSKLLTIYPAYAEAREYRAFSYFYTREYTRSIEDVNILIAGGANRSNLYNLMGVNFYNLDNRDEACKNFTRAKNMGDRDGLANFTRYCQPIK